MRILNRFHNHQPLDPYSTPPIFGIVHPMSIMDVDLIHLFGFKEIF